MKYLNWIEKNMLGGGSLTSSVPHPNRWEEFDGEVIYFPIKEDLGVLLFKTPNTRTFVLVEQWRLSFYIRRVLYFNSSYDRFDLNIKPEISEMFPIYFQRLPLQLPESLEELNQIIWDEDFVVPDNWRKILLQCILNDGIIEEKL